MDYQDQIEVERVAKQEYLRDAIINGGLDPLQFKEFCDAKKTEGGSNVDIWTMEELHQVVEEFRSRAGDEQQQQGYIDEKNTEFVVLQNASGKLNDSSIMEPYDPNKDKDEGYHKTLPVRKTEPTILHDEKDIEIIVSEPELVKGGLLTASYISYKITSRPFNWTVKRRFSDFFWLRSTLAKFYPSVIVPPIPKKKNKGKFENDFILKRMYFLESFLNNCLKSSELKSCKYLMYFLSIDDEKNWKAKQKEADKFIKYSKLEEYPSLGGQVTLDINAELKTFAGSATDLIYLTDPIYKRIRKLSKQLMLELDQVANTIFSLSECYGNLYGATMQFNKQVPIGKIPYLDDIYLNLNNMMVSWGEEMLGQKKIIQKHLNTFYKYAYYENESFKEVIKSRTNFGSEYIKLKKALLTKKEKFFSMGDITKWEISPKVLQQINKDDILKNRNIAFDVMFPKETAQTNEMKDYFSYYNHETLTELTRCMEIKCQSYSLNFFKFAQEQAQNLSEVHVHWADAIAHFSDVHSNKKEISLRKSMPKFEENPGFNLEESKVDDS